MRNHITFYSHEGVRLRKCSLPEGTSHSNRVCIAKQNQVPYWSHYMIRDSGVGMKNEEKPSFWYNISKETGLITNRASDKIPFS